jgi:hypothetical protein
MINGNNADFQCAAGRFRRGERMDSSSDGPAHFADRMFAP